MSATLTYHSIDDSGSAVSVSPAQFDEHLRWLTGGAVRVVSLDDVASRGAGTAGASVVAVTFDDGFVNARPAIVRLLDHGVPVTVFVATRHVGGTNAWGGRDQPGIPTLPLLGWDDLADLARRGARIEAHSRTHPKLTRVSDAQIDEELGGSQEDLRARLGLRSTHVAYPYGDVDDRVATRTAAFFGAGHTVEMALVGQQPVHRLPRVDMYYYRRTGATEAWGGTRFRSRLAWIRLRRGVRDALERKTGHAT